MKNVGSRSSKDYSNYPQPLYHSSKYFFSLISCDVFDLAIDDLISNTLKRHPSARKIMKAGSQC